MISAFKREDFARWRAGEKLPDDALCKAVKEMENTVSRQLIESLRGDLGALAKAGAISKVTMRQFDAICPALKLLNVIADKGLEARTAATC